MKDGTLDYLKFIIVKVGMSYHLYPYSDILEKKKKRKRKKKKKIKKLKKKREREKKKEKNKRDGLRGEVLVIRLPLCCPRVSREWQS